MLNKILEILWNLFQIILTWGLVYLVVMHRSRVMNYLFDKDDSYLDKFDIFKRNNNKK